MQADSGSNLRIDSTACQYVYYRERISVLRQLCA